MGRKIILVLIVVVSFFLNGFAQKNDCKIEILVQNEKPFYQASDTIKIIIKVFFEEPVCDNASEQTKVFCKGLEIIERSDWKKISSKILGQKLTLTVLNNNRTKSLTAYRKNAHQNCFAEKEFITKNQIE